MDTLKDYLEELMDLKRIASIKFRSVDGGITVTQGHIVKMDSPSGRDMIQTDTGAHHPFGPDPRC
jgi:hypothetical protein